MDPIDAENRPYSSRIWYVSNDFYTGEDISKIVEREFPRATLQGFFRDYHVKPAMASEPKPTLIITDGRRKTRPDEEPSESVGIFFPEIIDYAREHQIPVVSPKFCGVYLPKLVECKLKIKNVLYGLDL
mgnify:FL=1